ncbi:hypothetical protein ACHAXS_012682 [Conticribra weissflogii]
MIFQPISLWIYPAQRPAIQTDRGTPLFVLNGPYVESSAARTRGLYERVEDGEEGCAERGGEEETK